MFSNMIEFYARHKTAANIVMVVMLVTGIMSADRLNRQFFPDVDVEIVDSDADVDVDCSFL